MAAYGMTDGKGGNETEGVSHTVESRLDGEGN